MKFDPVARALETAQLAPASLANADVPARTVRDDASLLIELRRHDPVDDQIVMLADLPGRATSAAWAAIAARRADAKAVGDAIASEMFTMHGPRRG